MATETAPVVYETACASIGDPGGEMRTVVCASVLAFWTAFGVGANDVANAFATSVGSGAITLRQACVIASFCEFSGAVLMGSAVANTLKSKIVEASAFEAEPSRFMIGMICVMTATAMWLVLATCFKLPVSTTHTVVGSIAGFAVVSHAEAIRWSALGKVLVSWATAPALAGPVAGGLFFLIRAAVLRHPDAFQRARKAAPVAVVLTLCCGFAFLMVAGPRSFREATRSLPTGVPVAIALGAAVVLTVPCHLFLVPRLAEQAVPVRENEDDVELRDVGQQCGSDAGEGGEADADDAGGRHQDAGEQPCGGEDEAGIEARKETAEHFDEYAEAVFKHLQVVSACFASFAHGANDTANAVGPLAAIWGIYRHASAGRGTVEALDGHVPIWVLVLGGAGIVVGLSSMGWRIIEAMGREMCLITPARGYSIQTGSAFVVLVCSVFGVPVSSTHCQIGSTVAVGLLEGRRDAVNWPLLRRIVAGSIGTLAVSAATSGALYALAVWLIC
eukprot:TRINITY_DN2938_c0_g2_i1.p1 TRINITY_DN2938_c0_g2~~TRINITY_DN2938_c0_g2_i1.p1  ORF type:complete len:519 (+),score=133.53 TRINITY_DN2938_c0_g2_i1:49-1557(+)